MKPPRALASTINFVQRGSRGAFTEHILEAAEIRETRLSEIVHSIKPKISLNWRKLKQAEFTGEAL